MSVLKQERVCIFLIVLIDCIFTLPVYGVLFRNEEYIDLLQNSVFYISPNDLTTINDFFKAANN